MFNKGTSEHIVEDQAVALMHLPDRELSETRRRLETQARVMKSRS
jgi:hypothetical protein